MENQTEHISRRGFNRLRLEEVLACRSARLKKCGMSYRGLARSIGLALDIIDGMHLYSRSIGKCTGAWIIDVGTNYSYLQLKY